MNFEWKQIRDSGQYETGFIDVYELKHSQRAIAIINYLPQHTHKGQRVTLTLLLEGEKKNWSEVTIKNIFEDVEGRVKNVENFNFNNFNSLEYIDYQIFTLNNIDDFDYLGHGDYNFI